MRQRFRVEMTTKKAAFVFNVEICRDIDNVAVHCRWPLAMGSPKAGTIKQILPVTYITGVAMEKENRWHDAE